MDNLETAPERVKSPAPSRVGILPHPHRPNSPALAEEIAAQLLDWGVTPLIGYLDDEHVSERLLDQDLLVALGGDGTMLRAGHASARHGVPVLGVNLGSLGFLAEVEPEDWRAVLRRVTQGDYWIEERAMLHVELLRGEELLAQHELLNEATIVRDEFPRPLRLRTSVDGAHLTTYLADGVIVATATGSTAYALAAGGPILAPQMRNLMVIPIAPHLSLDRAVLLPEGSSVSVELVTHHHAFFGGDGDDQIRLDAGDRMLARPSEYTCRFVRVQASSYFYATLMRRLGLENLDHE